MIGVVVVVAGWVGVVGPIELAAIGGLFVVAVYFFLSIVMWRTERRLRLCGLPLWMR